MRKIIKFNITNIFALLAIIIFSVMYLIPWSSPTLLTNFHHRFSDLILISAILLTVLSKLFTKQIRLDFLFWWLMSAAFFSWLLLTIIYLIFWEQFNETKQDFISSISYFLYYILMIAAIEVKSYSSAKEFLSQKSLISSLTLVTFILGVFSYLVLIPNQMDIEPSLRVQQTFSFYMIMDLYIAARWILLSIQSKCVDYLGYFYLGIANIIWFATDLLEYMALPTEILYSSIWFDWLWYAPYFIFLIGINRIMKNDAISKKRDPQQPYHLLNNPLFFIGLLSVWFLIESLQNTATIEHSLQSIKIIWLLILVIFAFLQLSNLFKENNSSIQRLNSEKENNLSMIEELKRRSIIYENKISSNQIILDTINNAIFTVSIKGIIVSANRAASNLLGFSIKELLTKKITDLIPKDQEFSHFFNYQSNLQRLSKGPAGIELETLIQTKQNVLMLVHVTLSKNNSPNNNDIIISLADISVQKAAEDQLHNSKDNFIANMSHEFRTPLTIVNGIIDSLSSSEYQENKVEKLKTAKRNNLRLIHMVDQLLVLSKAASESSPISNIEVSTQLKSICDSYANIAKDKNINYQYNIADKVTIRGNQKSLETIIYNLLSNAFKFTLNGGSINVTVEEANIGYRLLVSDTGIGIAKKHQNTIFERFRRINTEEQSIPGVGIGLALVKELVSSMDWKIFVESSLNNGSIFIIELKQSTTDKLIENIPSNIKKNINQKTISHLKNELNSISQKNIEKSKYLILIIEDNLDMQRHLESILSPHHQCLLANSGSLGLNMANDYLPDVIISDVMMPGIDGFEVLEKIKTQPNTTHIPVILLTAKSDQESKLIGLKAEADDYLCKPFDEEELLIRIKNILNVRKKLQLEYQAQLQNPTQFESEKPETLIKNAFLKELNNIFEESYSETSFTMNHLASRLAMSERQLQRKVKALVDFGPLELLKRFRLEKAKILLKQEMQIGLVAQNCGFSSQTYFGRCFKEQFGITPKIYKQQNS